MSGRGICTSGFSSDEAILFPRILLDVGELPDFRR
jgi:hypothetical protein